MNILERIQNDFVQKEKEYNEEKSKLYSLRKQVIKDIEEFKYILESRTSDINPTTIGLIIETLSRNDVNSSNVNDKLEEVIKGRLKESEERKKRLEYRISLLEESFQKWEIFRYIRIFKTVTEDEFKKIAELKEELGEDYEPLIEFLKNNNNRLIEEKKAKIAAKENSNKLKDAPIIPLTEQELEYQRLVKEPLSTKEGYRLLEELGYNGLKEELIYIESSLPSVDTMESLKDNNNFYMDVLNVISRYYNLKKEIFVTIGMIDKFMNDTDIDKLESLISEIYVVKEKLNHYKSMFDNGFVSLSVSNYDVEELKKYYKDKRNVVLFLKEDSKTCLDIDVENDDNLDESSYGSILSTIEAMLKLPTIEAHKIKTSNYSDEFVSNYSAKTIHAGLSRIAFARAGTKLSTLLDLDHDISLIIILGSGYGNLSGHEKADIGERALRRLSINKDYIDEIISLYQTDFNTCSEEVREQAYSLLSTGYNDLKGLETHIKKK